MKILTLTQHKDLFRKTKALSILIVLVLGSMAFKTSEPTFRDRLDKSIVVCGEEDLNLSAIQPAQSGLWSSPGTWPGGVLPTSNDDVTIPSGVTLTMTGECRAKDITVEGTLDAINTTSTDAWIDLRAQSIMVLNGGKMEIGTEDQPYHASKNMNGIRCQITLTGGFVEGAPARYKGIMVMNGGRLELHGKQKKSWTNVGTTAEVGSTQIMLKESVDWEVGDVIALTSTDLAVAVNGTKKGAWENVDQVEIQSISGDGKALTLTTPLKYRHVGGTKSYTRDRDGKTWNVEINGEVGLLSHYIKIQGDMSGTNEADGFGGHIMLMLGSIAHVEHVELYKMGQKGILARYPFHWHLNEDQA